MDFQCAPAITKAMHRVADFGTFGYTTADSTPEYKQSIISWYDRRFGMKLEKNWIIHSDGALDGVEQVIRAFSEPGDGVILCHPVYSNFISLLVGALYNIVDQIFIANASYLGSYGNAANTVVFPLTVVASVTPCSKKMCYNFFEKVSD